MKTVCGAKTRSGGLCQKPPLIGAKRCALHGGKTPRGEESPHFKTGRYGIYVRQSLQEKLATVDDANPLDILPELQMQRALFAEYVSRFETGVPLAAGDIHSLMDWSEAITRTVERVVKMRNDTALTAAEVALIAARIPEVVMKYLHDPTEQQRFISDLFTIVGVPESANQPQLGGGANAG